MGADSTAGSASVSGGLALSTGPALPSPPAYGRKSIAEVFGSAAASIGVPGFENRLSLPPARRVCVVLADGLGRQLLKQRAAHTPFLRSVLQSGQGEVPAGVDAAFPSTTAASLASLGTGRSAGQHGMVGYDVVDPDQDRVVNMLSNWDDGVDPRRWQPMPTVFERAAEHAGRQHRRPAPLQRLRHDPGGPARRHRSSPAPPRTRAPPPRPRRWPGRRPR